MPRQKHLYYPTQLKALQEDETSPTIKTKNALCVVVLWGYVEEVLIYGGMAARKYQEPARTRQEGWSLRDVPIHAKFKPLS
jgi:hypothetical protein